MAEIAATVIGIGGIVSITKDVFDVATGLREYYKEIKSVNDDISAMTLQLNTNLEIFQRLDDFYKASRSPVEFDSFKAGTTLRTAIDRYVAQLQTLKASLVGLSTKISGSGGGRAQVSMLYEKIHWPFRHKDFRNAVANLQLYGQLFLSACTIDGSKLLAKTSTEVASILSQQQNITDEVKSTVAALELLKDVPAGVLELKLSLQSLEAKELLKEDAKLLQWLSPETMLQTLHDIIARRAGGTCTWIFQHPIYETWKDCRQQSSMNRSLWCHGHPGMGKTILAATVIDNLLQTSSITEDVVLYYFCDYRNENHQGSTSLIRCITKQLAEVLLAKGESVSELKLLHKRLKNGERPPDKDETIMVFHAFSKRANNVTIVVDGLDECTDPDNREAICRFLFDAQKHNQNIASLVTSRPNFEDINILFEVIPFIDVSGLQSDIETYVSARLNQNRLLHRRVAKWNGLLEEIKDGIVKHSGNIFLVAVLQTEWVMCHRTVDQIRKALGTLPERLEDAYARNIERVMNQPGPDQRLCLRAMLWTITARRPLHIGELCQALALSDDGDTPSLSEGNILQIEDILTICGGLIVVDYESQIVRVLHYTTQAYLEKHYRTVFQSVLEGGLQSLDGQVASDCLIYLSLQAQPSFKELDTYIGNFVGVHLCRSTLDEHERLVSLGLSILDNKERLDRVKKIIPLLAYEAVGCYNEGYMDPMSRSNLHIAVRWGLIPLIEALCDTGCLLDVRDENENTPLNIAVDSRNVEVVNCLLNRGCDPGLYRSRIAGGIEWWESCTPLQDAYRNRDVEIFGLLLDKLRAVDYLILGGNNWDGSNFSSILITPRRLNRDVNSAYIEMFSLLAKRLSRAPDEELKALLHYMIKENLWELTVATLSPQHTGMDLDRQLYLLSDHLNCEYSCRYNAIYGDCGGERNRARLNNIRSHLDLDTSERDSPSEYDSLSDQETCSD